VNFQITVTFVEEIRKTRVTVQMLSPSAAAREHVIKKYGADEGLKQTLERLAAQLSKMFGQ